MFNLKNVEKRKMLKKKNLMQTLNHKIDLYFAVFFDENRYFLTD